METTDTKKKINSERMQVAILILTIIAICCFIVAIIVLVKNVDEIKTNPIVYGIDRYTFDSCTCFGEGVGVVDFYSTKRGIEENRTG